MNSQSENSKQPLESRKSLDAPSPAGPDFADTFRRRRVRGPRGMAPGRRVWITLGWTAAAVAVPLALTAALAGDGAGAGDLGDSQEAAAARALPPPPALVLSPTPKASPTPTASPTPKVSPTPKAAPLPAAPAQAYQPALPAAPAAPAAPSPQKTVAATPKPSTAAPKAALASVPETAAVTVSRLAARQPGRHICYRAYVEGRGWQSVVCDGGTTGITGKKIKALNIAVSGTKGTAGNAFVHNDEWKTPWNGVADGNDNYIGSTAKNYPYMLGFVINVGDGAVCQTARVRSGWGGLACDKPLGQAGGNYIFGGTLNNDSWLEAVRFTV
ncbi:hypothetical protein ACFYPN_11545 [Streptomyces sp. NPDC005576]|uniref:hypothetical protein n=1 Tax=unclassified Streptomyces TaxID=2593676 RepID=UPI0033C03A66